MRKTRPAIDRFNEKVHRTAGCWLWTAATFDNGYGAFRDGALQRRAHRWSYEHHVGPIPEGAILMHTCDERRCVTPAHLVPGSQLDNQQDMTAKGRGRTGDRNGWRQNAPKLSLAVAGEIRAKYAAGGVRQADLAAEYGVNQTMISMIIRGVRWA